jgi:hypothetical protein
MLFDHAVSVFVLAQRHKFRMSKVIAFGPLQEFDLSNESRADPNALLHAFGRQSFAPARTTSLWKIGERASRYHKGL